MRQILQDAWQNVVRHDRLIGGIILTLLLAAGVAYSFTLGNTLRFLPDEADYAAITENLVTKGFHSLDGSQPTAYRPPGYPWLLLPVRALGGGILQYRVLNYVTLALAFTTIYLILRKQGALPGALGVLLGGAYAVNFFTAGTLYPQTLAGALLVGLIYIYSHARLPLWVQVLAGLLGGWLILTVPTFISAIGVLAVWLAFSRRGATAAILVGVAALMVGSWSLRNLAVFDTLIFVSTNSGENLLLGNSENTTPNGGRTVDISRYEQAAAGMDEANRDRYYRESALQYIRNHPLAAVRMYLLKVLNTFNYRNELVTTGQASGLRDRFMMLSYGLLLLIFVTRLILAQRHPLSKFEWLLVWLYVTGAMFSAIFFTRIRFRLPYDLLLVLADAQFLNRLFQRQFETAARNEGKSQL